MRACVCVCVCVLQHTHIKTSMDIYITYGLLLLELPAEQRFCPRKSEKKNLFFKERERFLFYFL